MANNRSSLFSIIAIIIGASGLGLGAFSIVNFQMVEGPQGPPGEDGQDGTDGINGEDGINGTDGIDAPFYCCSSQSEIEEALNTIGTGHGTIFITEDITLNSTINIDDGGSYTIKGVAPSITVGCNGDWSAFKIMNCLSCLIADLTINASDITSDNTRVIDISQDHSNIENVQILGDADRNGYGIYINANYIWVSNCFINEVKIGINIQNGIFTHISENTIAYCDDGSLYGDSWGILGGERSIIDSNSFYYCRQGIMVGSENIISGNNLWGNPAGGIDIGGDRNIISNNRIYGAYSISSTISNAGIAIWSGVNVYYNSITNNFIEGFLNSGSGIGYGIYLLNTAFSTTIVGNTVRTCDVRFEDWGIGTYVDSNNGF